RASSTAVFRLALVTGRSSATTRGLRHRASIAACRSCRKRLCELRSRFSLSENGVDFGESVFDCRFPSIGQLSRHSYHALHLPQPRPKLGKVGGGSTTILKQISNHHGELPMIVINRIFDSPRVQPWPIPAHYPTLPRGPEPWRVDILWNHDSFTARKWNHYLVAF